MFGVTVMMENPHLSVLRMLIVGCRLSRGQAKAETGRNHGSFVSVFCCEVGLALVSVSVVTVSWDPAGHGGLGWPVLFW